MNLEAQDRVRSRSKNITDYLWGCLRLRTLQRLWTCSNCGACMRCTCNLCTRWWATRRNWVESISWTDFKYRGLVWKIYFMHDPTVWISFGSCQGFPLKILLILNGISMIDDRQILPIALGSGIASVVPCGLKEVVVSYAELRWSVSRSEIQDKWDGSWMVIIWTHINSEDQTNFPIIGFNLLGFCSDYKLSITKGVVVYLIKRHGDPHKCLEAWASIRVTGDIIVHVHGHLQLIRPYTKMNCLGKLTLSAKYNITCHGLKVYDSLLSASILEVRVYKTVGDALSHSFAVMKERVVWKSSVVTVLVIHLYVEASCMPLETFIGVYCLLRGDPGHAVDVLQVWEVIHQYRCISMSLLREPSFHVRNKSHPGGL